MQKLNYFSSQGGKDAEESKEIKYNKGCNHARQS